MRKHARPTMRKQARPLFTHPPQSPRGEEGPNLALYNLNLDLNLRGMATEQEEMLRDLYMGMRLRDMHLAGGYKRMGPEAFELALLLVLLLLLSLLLVLVLVLYLAHDPNLQFENKTLHPAN